MAERLVTTRADENVAQQTTSTEALLVTMRARFQQAEEFESTSRAEELDDLRFSHGEQWPTEIANRRRQDNRPCLTINQMPQYIRQITNEERQARLAIRIIPVDDNADIETAKILQGLVRAIEVDSDADVAYETAGEAAARSGLGYFRIVTEYADQRSFDKVIKIKRIRNRFTVYMDPASQEFDYSDADWGMIIGRMSRDRFLALYPGYTPHNMAEWASEGDGWVDTDEVRIAEYFYIERERRSIVLLQDGSVHEEAELQADRKSEIIDRRTSVFPIVYWVKSNGHEVMEGPTRFPGQYIPILPVIGDQADVNGKVTYSGIVRHGKDPHRMYNYYASAEAETIDLAPRNPWVGPEGSFEGHKQRWTQANRRNIPFLEYAILHDKQGNRVEPPTRQYNEPAIQGITNARLMAREDLKSTTGIYDASLGAQGNESSGRAIIARQREGDTATFHYPSNLGRALRHAGRIMLGIIPQIYSRPRVARIIGEDDSVRTVRLNEKFTDEDGIDRIYRPGVGRYDVVVDIGPAYNTKRQEAATSQLELIKAFPPLFERAGHVMVKNMDWEGAQEIADLITPPDQRKSQDGLNPKEELQQLRGAIPELHQKLQAMHEYAKQCEAKAAELEQQNAQMTVAAQSKAAELTVKQEEGQAKAAIDREELTFKREELELEREKTRIEELKVSHEIAKWRMEVGGNEAQLTQLAAERQAVQSMDEAAQQRDLVLTEALQSFAAIADEVRQMVQEEREQRLAPKTVSVRRENGALVGTVSSNGSEARSIEIRPTDGGYTGEIE